MAYTLQDTIETLLASLHPRRFLPRVVTLDRHQLSVGGQCVSLRDCAEVVVIGLGKAAYAQVYVLRHMLLEAVPQLVRRDSLVVTKHGHGGDAAGIRVLEAAHPICDATSLRAAEALCAACTALPADAVLVLCLSGGGSALAEMPRAPFSFAQQQRAFGALVNGGASIEETNLLRKEMSAIKNGGMAALTGCQHILTLVTSDVPTDDLSVVASGPTLHHTLDPQQVESVARRYLPADLAAAVCDQLDSQARRVWSDRQAQAVERKRLTTICIADARQMLAQAETAIAEAGCVHVVTMQPPLNMGIDAGVALHLEQLAALLRATPGRPAALVSGGELPVHVTGSGLGGRNMEFVLRMGKSLFEDNVLRLSCDTLSAIQIASVGTDGQDGPTPHAGAWFDAERFDAARRQGLRIDDFLANNDSQRFFAAIGTLIDTGPTQTNLMDLRVLSVRAGAEFSASWAGQGRVAAAGPW